MLNEHHEELKLLPRILPELHPFKHIVPDNEHLGITQWAEEGVCQNLLQNMSCQEFFSALTQFSAMIIATVG